ncbi:MAG: hypothetical protein ACRDT0_08835 [Pseudonocardiaceae bacterium]
MGGLRAARSGLGVVRAEVRAQGEPVFGEEVLRAEVQMLPDELHSWLRPLVASPSV